MELKEVIHFYLGAKVEYEFTSRTSNKEIRNGKMYGMWDNFIRISTHWGSTEAPISSVKPILRKLDSMTEEEYEEYKNIGIEESKENWKYQYTIESSRKMVYLLSRHFDLFNLIESGQAIDATTLTQNK